eukprot:CAMPEP_0114569892 /NCGR_PEP_ID=MMETSP0114-20121206/16887_1 /TAXON_ID=31324 /ORGANISM="Goniomonas sp, Strain m" /LENGTH=43 /DNA_ID= /DNA_START= /DNA_END= /DNA_ORIENTATION=
MTGSIVAVGFGLPLLDIMISEELIAFAVRVWRGMETPLTTLGS